MSQDSLVALKNEQTQLQAIMSLYHKADTAVLALQEISYLEAMSIRMPIIRGCEPLSVLLAVKSVLKMNLTMDPNAGLVYVTTRSVKTNNGWVTAMEIEPTANGRLSYARMCGRILDHKNPVVYFNESGKVNKVSVELLKPSVPQPRWETYEFTEEVDFYRWARASHKQNRRAWDNADAQKRQGKKEPNDDTMNYANEHYTSFKGGIDPEFARAKALKHALKKLGTNQSELKPGQLVIHKAVDINADMASTKDEFVQHEVISSTIPGSENNGPGADFDPHKL